MERSFKELTGYIIDLGAASIGHTDKTYLAHAIGVYNDMKAWGEDEEMCRAALFHSIYGTQGFQDFTLPLERRDELIAFIGERAERLAYANCFMDRQTLDDLLDDTRTLYPIRHRVTGNAIELTHDEYNDLCRLHLCDWLEQVPRAQLWNTRRAAYRKMAERLGGIALESYDRVFAQEYEVTE